jgi:hypothetical protein
MSKDKALPMSDTYTFEHEGVTVEYAPATIRTLLEKRRILVALINVYGLQDQDVPSDTWEEFDNFATAMAQSKANAAWWTRSMAMPERIQEAFECFMAQPPILLTNFLIASNAVATPKKTAVITTET